MVTIKQLAELCGVSRGTVDRVLNNRGKVNPEKAELIRRTAERLNYQPNPAGKALIARRKNLTVAIVMPSVGIAFFDDVIAALKQAEQKYALFGLKVIWRLSRGYDVAVQAAALDELADEVQALIINPIDDPHIVEKINGCVSRGIFVVTLNNDTPQSKRHAYVGPDYRSGGETAGELMSILAGEPKTFGVTLGSRQILGHRLRLEGFVHAIQKIPGARIAAVWEDGDDDIQGYETTKTMLTQHPEIDALFLASSGGAYGTCRAVRALHSENDLRIVAFDTTPPIVEMMKAHVIDAVLYQHPHTQGTRAMQLVYDYLFNGIESDHDQHIMQNEIRLLANL